MTAASAREREGLAARDRDGGEPLQLWHAAEIAALLASRGSGAALSESSFANLYLFRHVHAYRFHRLPHPHITGRTYDGARHVLPLVPLDPDVAAALIVAGDCLYPIDERDVDAIGAGWRAAANPHDSDYLYDAAVLAAVPPTKRREVERLERDHDMALLPEPPDFARHAEALLAVWLGEVGKDPAETDHDVCREAIALAGPLGLRMILAASEGKPCGFLLASTLADGSVAVHFAKATRRLPGVYPWMFSRFARLCDGKLLNFEQDLGHPGIRRAKRALEPITQLPKYRLSRAA